MPLPGHSQSSTPHYFIILFFTANLSRLAVWWVCNVGSGIKFLINYIISLIRPPGEERRGEESNARSKRELIDMQLEAQAAYCS